MLRAEAQLTIGELSARTGVATSALRYYEDRGLISSERTAAGHRRYARLVVRRVAFIVFAQRIGMDLAKIGEELAKLPTDRVPTGQDWAQLSASWEALIEERIAVLERLKNSLDDCIGCGCLSLERCQVLNSGDHASRAGAGPRYWIGNPRAGGE